MKSKELNMKAPNCSKFYRLPFFALSLLIMSDSFGMFVNDFDLIPNPPNPDFSVTGRIVTQAESGNLSDLSELAFSGNMFGYNVDFDLSHVVNAPFNVLSNGAISIFLLLRDTLPNGAQLTVDFEVGDASCFDTISNVACDGSGFQDASFSINRTIPITTVPEPRTLILLVTALVGCAINLRAKTPELSGPLS